MAHNNSIDGFFLSRHDRKQQGVRPSLDSLHSGQRAAHDGAPRLKRRTTEPAGGSVAGFFQAVPASAAAPSTQLPRPSLGSGGDGGKAASARGGLLDRLRLKKPSRRTMKRAGIAALVVLVLVGGYFLVKFFLASGQIFRGNAFTAIFSQGKPLEADANGRSNILLFGTSEDDPGHEGAELSDSIMMVSIDQKKKDAFIVSVPRDFYVEYSMACNSGYEGKINEVYLCGKANGKNVEEAGQKALRGRVGEIFGVKMHYSAHVNYTALRDIVDAVGGINVTIDSDDPRGVLDRNFDWRCNYECNYVKHPNGPAKLNGEKALALARARGSVAPTYGFSGGNFDREQYQRKILVALKDKAASAGTLANPVKVNNLIDALGKNVRTTFDAEEVKTLAQLGQDIKADKIRSLNLVDEKAPLVTTGDVGGASVVQPSAGLYDYTDLAAAVKAYATGDTAYLEGATVDVLNASGQAGVAQKRADKLSEAGLAVEIVGNAPESLDTAPLQLYNLSNTENPATLKKLESLLGVKASSGVPAGVSSNSDFVVIAGKARNTQQ